MKEPLPCQTWFEESSLRGPLRGLWQSLRRDDRLLRCARNGTSHLTCDQPAGHGTNPTRQGTDSVQDRRKGFVLILIVLLIAVVGAEMFVLSGISNRMLFDSNTAQLEALEGNLSASGLAWARHISTQNTEAFGTTVELDVASMGVSGATLSVTLGVPKDRTVQVQVNTTCSRGLRMLKRSHTHILDLRPSGGA